jgi:hypothetical protein
MNTHADLEGLTALVTGATSGIGQATARELARHGADVIVHGRDADRGTQVVDAITADDGSARFAAADLTDPAQLDELAGQGDMVDILVNNAGFSWFGPTQDLDVATFDRLFAANVRAAYFLVGALAPKMAARGAGSIISLASMAGQIGLRRYQGSACVHDAVLGGRVQSFRNPSQCRRCRASADRRRSVRPHRGTRRYHAAVPCCPACRDRRGHHVPRLPEGQLYHRRRFQHRRRPYRHLAGHVSLRSVSACPLPGMLHNQALATPLDSAAELAVPICQLSVQIRPPGSFRRSSAAR